MHIHYKDCTFSWKPEGGDPSKRTAATRVAIAQHRRGCSLSRVRVNGVIIHLRPGGRIGIVTL